MVRTVVRFHKSVNSQYEDSKLELHDSAVDNKAEGNGRAFDCASPLALFLRKVQRRACLMGIEKVLAETQSNR